MNGAILMRQPDGTARLYTPFDADFVDDLKARIPARLRRWDKPDKCWVVSATGIDRAKIIAIRFYGHVEDIPPPSPQSNAVAVTPFAVLHLTPDAPADLVPIVYRHLAKAFHPDRGGDTRQMQQINEAYEKIRKGIGR